MSKVKKIFHELSIAEKIVILAKYKEQELNKPNQSVCSVCISDCNSSECDLKKLI